MRQQEEEKKNEVEEFKELLKKLAKQYSRNQGMGNYSGFAPMQPAYGAMPMALGGYSPMQFSGHSPMQFNQQSQMPSYLGKLANSPYNLGGNDNKIHYSATIKSGGDYMTVSGSYDSGKGTGKLGELVQGLFDKATPYMSSSKGASDKGSGSYTKN